MPVVQIATFAMDDQQKAEELLTEMTATMHRVTGIPLDKISVYLTEIQPARWADAGVVGSDPDFRTASRRMDYDTPSETEKARRTA
ncbi:4-oxalocrotonate tautomerase [Rhodovulum imhoffii]|uniref:4-oxalocrotonate tautomerase n=1 Tax=Rhodovulum imhoffii TaxID=365340 RepID=A0A2T5BQB4_9RHOB|nr:tautomerase family protein [Rhodovulum imhoffii]MBK5933700.1 tautomerase [Rhodovulum imhoffii]PTN01316.1 4-oxalocrotonate tautomerase [Rhodovulum imhoffii]